MTTETTETAAAGQGLLLVVLATVVLGVAGVVLMLG